jgi:Zn-dependent peptidase ImmA (M78 family)
MTTSTKRRPETVLRRGFKAEAERIAIAMREEIGLSAHDALPAAALAKHLEIRIMTPDEIPGMDSQLRKTLLEDYKGNWSAGIYIKNNRKYILHNPTHSSARQESNLMHELAHALCGHELKELATVLTNCIIPLRDYDVVQEAEAECLGGCLQLPQKALIHHVHYKKKDHSEIAQLFNASIKMVSFRISTTGINNIKFRGR